MLLLRENNASNQLDVTIGSSTFEMLICSYLIPACCFPECKAEGALEECKKRIRSFHPECRKIEKMEEELTERDAPEDLCDSCLCEDVISVDIDMPVVAFCPETNKFKMGMVLAADELGSTRIEWLVHGLPDGSSLVPNSHVAEVRESYLHLAERNQKSYWETTFDDYKDEHLQRYPTVFKKVFKTVNKSRYADGNKTMRPTKFKNVCQCGIRANCVENECHNAIDNRECPPSCSRNKTPGFVCYNRKISTGFVNTMKKKKGYGIFTTKLKRNKPKNMTNKDFYFSKSVYS